MAIIDSGKEKLRADIAKVQRQEQALRDLRPSLTASQRDLLDRITGKVTPEWGIDINIGIDTPKQTRNTFVATKKFVASLVVEANNSDKFDQTVKIVLTQVQLTSDDLTDLLSKAHGHLELVSDK